LRISKQNLDPNNSFSTKKVRRSRDDRKQKAVPVQKRLFQSSFRKSSRSPSMKKSVRYDKENMSPSNLLTEMCESVKNLTESLECSETYAPYENLVGLMTNVEHHKKGAQFNENTMVDQIIKDYKDSVCAIKQFLLSNKPKSSQVLIETGNRPDSKNDKLLTFLVKSVLAYMESSFDKNEEALEDILELSEGIENKSK